MVVGPPSAMGRMWSISSPKLTPHPGRPHPGPTYVDAKPTYVDARPTIGRFNANAPVEP
jgi:hypothetical protein